MVIPKSGDVVVLPFPFSDLSENKVRPAVVLACANKSDWILCQITSNPYGEMHRRLSLLKPISNRGCYGFKVMHVHPSCLQQMKV
jgi:hypothetical protein